MVSRDGLVKYGETRRSGTYYKLTERKMLLKKKRAEVHFLRCRTQDRLFRSRDVRSFLF
jgi:hypothetical protein